MRKLTVLGSVLLVSLGLATASFAAQTAIVNIRVIVSSGNVSIESLVPELNAAGSTDAFKMAAGSNTIIGGADMRAIFKNNGDTNTNWSVSVSNLFAGTNNPSGWPLDNADVPGTVMPAANTCRLAAMFTYYTNYPEVAKFGANDCLKLGLLPADELWCDNSNCADDSEAAEVSGVKVKGNAVLPTEERSLMFSFDTPLAGSNGLGYVQVATVKVTAYSY